MSEATALQQRMFDTVRSRDFDALRALYHPDYVYMSGDGVERKGAEVGVEVARGYTAAFPDLTFEIRREYAAGDDAAIMELIARGTHRGELEGIPPTGRQVEVVVCNVVEARDGRIYREREYYDGMSMLAQLGVVPGAATSPDEAVVRRYYEEMCSGRRNELAPELFTADHVLHDPQVSTGPGPSGAVDAVRTYQDGADGHWTIEEMYSAGDRVTVRWTGTGTHVGEINGVPPTGRPIRVDALSVHRMVDGRIAETWEVWDTLGFLQQIGVVPQG